MSFGLPEKKIWSIVALTVFLLSAVAFNSRRLVGYDPVLTTTRSANRMAQLPPLILWAWERPEKLGFINPQRTGVAFLAKTLYLHGDKVVTRPRLQPLDVPPGTVLIAVARIEVERSAMVSHSVLQSRQAAVEIAELAQLARVAAVQVDFDARASEREFYRQLLLEVRKELPDATALSITALASWCQGDNWLDHLPVDEAVPMLFRMGQERKQILSALATENRFRATPCQASAGVATDEPVLQLPSVQRLYVFNPRVWTPRSLSQLMETYQDERQGR